MPETNRLPTMETMTTTAVAAYLAEEVGGDQATWITWLKNDRRPGRANRLPPLPGPGRPKYLPAAVDAFVSAERARQLKAQSPISRVTEVMRAVGIGEDGGSPTGRRLDSQVTDQVDEYTGEPFVQLVIAHPLLIFRMSPDQAMALGASLVGAAKSARRTAARGKR